MTPWEYEDQLNAERQASAPGVAMTPWEYEDSLSKEEKPKEKPKDESVSSRFSRILNDVIYSDAMTYANNVAGSIATGLTLGMNRVAEAGVRSVLEDRSFGDVSHEVSERSKKFSEENPVVSTGAELLGGIPSVGKIFKVGSAAKSALPQLGKHQGYVRNTLKGAGAGGVYGLGTADYSEGFDDAAWNALSGAATGAVMAPVLQGVGNRVGNMVNRARANDFKGPLVKRIPEGAKQKVSGLLDSVAPGAKQALLPPSQKFESGADAVKAKAANSLEKKGFFLTPHQKTGSRTAEAIEANARKRSAVAPLFDEKVKQNQRVLNSIFAEEAGFLSRKDPFSKVNAPVVTHKMLNDRTAQLYNSFKNSKVRLTFPDKKAYNRLVDVLKGFDTVPQLMPKVKVGKKKMALDDYLGDVFEDIQKGLSPAKYMDYYASLSKQRREFAKKGKMQYAEAISDVMELFDDIADRAGKKGGKEQVAKIRDFHAARKLYKLRMAIGEGGDVIDSAGNINYEALRKRLSSNDVPGFIREGSDSEFYKTVRELGALEGNALKTHPMLPSERSSPTAMVVQPVKDMFSKIAVEKMFEDPAYTMENRGGDFLNQKLLKGLLQTREALDNE